MVEKVKAVHYERRQSNQGCDVGRFGWKHAQKVNKFHKSFPEYRATPLVELKNLSQILGVADIYVKDESYRFGLNAFKVLGGSYCIGSYIANRLNMDMEELSYDQLVTDDTKEKLGKLTFVTATDGNHGRGIAWMASQVGQKSVVYMPKGSAEERLANIKALGADAEITELNYDDTVEMAQKKAEKNGWILLQDTAWEGYETIPDWIMQGYTTMAAEAVNQLQGVKPTHIFLQAGVGAMSGAITGFFADLYQDEERPRIIIVEPNKADCIYRTAEANDGCLHIVEGDMDTIMAGVCWC